MKIEKICTNIKINNDVKEVNQDGKKSLFRSNIENKAEHIAEEKELRAIRKICNDQSINAEVQIRKIVEELQDDNALFKMLSPYHQEQLMELLVEFFHEDAAGRKLFHSLMARIKE